PPNVEAVAKVSADAHCQDSRVQSARVKGQLAAFTPADDADFHGGWILVRHPIDCSKHFLNLVPDEVPAELEGRPIDKLSIRKQLLRIYFPTDQYRNDDLASALSQTPRELALGRDPTGQAD